MTIQCEFSPVTFRGWNIDKGCTWLAFVGIKQEVQNNSNKSLEIGNLESREIESMSWFFLMGKRLFNCYHVQVSQKRKNTSSILECNILNLIIPADITKYSASLTCCVNNKSEEVSSWGCEVYPLDGAPVVGAVSHSHFGQDQGAIASQVNSSL